MKWFVKEIYKMGSYSFKDFFNKTKIKVEGKTEEENLALFLNALPEEVAKTAKICCQVTGDTDHSFSGPTTTYIVCYLAEKEL